MQAGAGRAFWQTAAIVAILLTVTVLAASPADAAMSVTTESLTWLWYATAQTQSSGAALSEAPLAAGAASYSTKSLQSGAQDSLARMQGNSVEALEFRSPPINRTLYFNLTGIVHPTSPTVLLTGPVNFVIHWGTTFTGKTSLYSADYSVLRVELHAGSKLVAGGDIQPSSLATSATFTKTTIPLFPEVTSLPAGEVLTLKIWRLGGFADFSVGTAKPQQTYIMVRGYTVDPLAGALYLEGSKLSANPFAISPTPSPPPEEGAAAALLPLLLVGVGRRRTAKVVVAAFLVAAFAGCLGDGSAEGQTETQAIRPSVSATSEIRGDLVAAGHGAIEGAVQDDLGLAVRSAHLSLPGTSLFTDTDARGKFRFPNVTAGGYILRVDSPGYPPLEQDIRVKSGEVLQLLITMVKARSSNANLERHLHDDWQGKDSLVLIDDDLMPASTGNQRQSDVYYCIASTSACDFKFFVPTGKVVPPGSTRVEVVITLPSGSNADKEVSLSVFTGTTIHNYGVRGSGQPFNVVFFPDESDRGHQKFSYWTFTGRLRPFEYGSSTSSHAYPTYTTGGKAHILVTAFKGVVPYEAPHKEPWGTATRLPVAKSVTAYAYSWTAQDYPAGTTSFKPGPRMLVPAGTMEVRGTMTWNAQYGADVVTWGLKYRTADIPPADWASNLKTPVTLKPNATTPRAVDFVIQVQPGEEDPFYAANSNWEFFPDDQSDPVAGGVNPRSSTYHQQTLTLTAYAYRDPTWKLG